MNLVSRLLKKNLSPSQLIGFTISNFVGLAIVVTGIQLYEDVRSIWEDEDSFIKKDYIVVNKEVTSSNTLGAASGFTEEEQRDLQGQPWVRKIGKFTANDYKVYASIDQGGRGMSTYMFFESLPDEFIDVKGSGWHYQEGSTEVPIVMSKDYLTLYNFGFASSAGLPQMSEALMESIPLQLRIASEDGQRTALFSGRVVGFSNRLNTILVPQSFMDWSNREFGRGTESLPSRLIVDVSSPGDVAIGEYLKGHHLEVAGDKKNSQASYMLNIITGVMLGIGGVITILSFFILMLSISLLMTKNRDKLHSLLMLGYPAGQVGRPYEKLIVWVCLVSFVLAMGAMFCVRMYYIEGVKGMTDAVPNLWLSPVVGIGLTILIIVFNVIAVRRKVVASFRIRN